MNYQFSKLLDEASSPQESLEERCAQFCDPEKIQPGTSCPGSCLNFCWSICSLTFFPPPPPSPPFQFLLPPIPPLPPIFPGDTNTDHHQPEEHGELIAASLVFAFITIAMAIAAFIRRAFRSSRSPEAPGSQPQAQEDHGGRDNDDSLEPEVDHPIWYIRSVGLKSSEIRLITICKYKKGGDEVPVERTLCAVCLNEFEEDENLKLLPDCKHAFHITCIDKWLTSHTNCPICRAAVVINPVVLPSPRQHAGDNSGALEETQERVPGNERSGFEMGRENEFRESSVEDEAEGESQVQSPLKSSDQDLENSDSRKMEGVQSPSSLVNNATANRVRLMNLG